MECGGSIGQLKIVKWGSEWMTADELENRLDRAMEFAVSFDGEFCYSDEDFVLPREFENDFQGAKDVVIVENYNGSILRLGNANWPRTLVGHTIRHGSNLADRVWSIVAQTWGDPPKVSLEERVVGRAAGIEIVRDVAVIRPMDGNG